MSLSIRSRPFLASVGSVALALVSLQASPARAASLQQVNQWGATNVPNDVSMYVYVPDQVAAKPPVLVLIHYCGGTAPAVFGQAQGGGIVQAADQYGFIMVVPSSGRCWDVVSDKTRTRDGGGDSDAIMQMVRYALDTYDANADRVYATGDSSGGMMTELLLALYPEVFKAGAAFAGMPAGCRGANESGNGGGYSGACAGGNVMHTAEEWGDIARGLAPQHQGYRPRVQLFHGDADDIINFKNHTEAIKEWSDVLGLATDPTTTDTGVQLGNHQATRQRWENACGQVVLDAFTSQGGDHGPSDALFPSKYVIPFLGLDKAGMVDPLVEQCPDGAGGAGGTSAGGSAAGGASGAGGSASGGAAGGVTSGGGTSAGSAGSFGTGGSAGSGGAIGTSGGSAAGGTGNSSQTAGMTNGPVSESSGCAYAGGRTSPRGVLGTLAAVLAFAGLRLGRHRRAARRNRRATNARFRG